MFKRVLSKFLTPNSTETPVPREEYRNTEFSTPERTKTIFVDLDSDEENVDDEDGKYATEVTDDDEPFESAENKKGKARAKRGKANPNGSPDTKRHGALFEALASLNIFAVIDVLLNKWAASMERSILKYRARTEAANREIAHYEALIHELEVRMAYEATLSPDALERWHAEQLEDAKRKVLAEENKLSQLRNDIEQIKRQTEELEEELEQHRRMEVAGDC